ncbi:MAG: hypothetical protein ACKN89_12260 [Cyanobium sp.]
MDAPAQASPNLLEGPVPFAASRLWRLQRQYFAQRGRNAWRDGAVPHYVTTNPAMAAAIAEVLVAFRLDRLRRDPSAPPLLICELGAGSGRFSYHLLLQLLEIGARAGLEPGSFRLVLSDFCVSNLQAWARHPRLQPFFASGLADRARVDITRTSQLRLEHSGLCLGPGELAEPLVLIANYVFDGVPTDLLRFQGGEVQRGLVSLQTPRAVGAADPADLLGSLQLSYSSEPLPAELYGDPGLDQLLADYQQVLADGPDAWMLFPAPALLALNRLGSLSQQGLLLLSADKGHSGLAENLSPAPPGLVHHESVSLSVNYHAFCHWGEAAGGLALRPEPGHGGLHCIALLLLPHAADYTATQAAWRRHVAAFSPDDYLALSQHAQALADGLSARKLFAFLRLGQADSHLFARLLPRLQELVPSLSPGEQEALLQLLERVWEGHFPLMISTDDSALTADAGENDMAFGIGVLLLSLGHPQKAIEFFEASLQCYGHHPVTLHNLQICQACLQG